MHTMCVLASILLHIFRCESNIMNEWMGKCCERDAFLRVFVIQQQTVKCTRKRDKPLARTYISWWYISCTTHARDYYFDLCACLYVFHKLTGNAARKRPDSEFRIANSNFNWYCNTQFFIWCAFSHCTLYSLFYLTGFWLLRCIGHHRVVRMLNFHSFHWMYRHFINQTDPDVCAINFIFACCKSITHRIWQTDEREPNKLARYAK